jgi:protein-tyrosine phosphatase
MADTEPHGFIDLHSHLIPGVDDGCRRAYDSLACIRRLREVGFTGSVCTPHVWPDLYPANTPAAIRGWVDALRDAVAAAGIDYWLWPGGEIRIARGMKDWFDRHGVPTLGASRCVLVDYWGGDWPPFADDFLEWLLAGNYQPILAHPERMGLADVALFRLADSLIKRGVWLQGNLRSLAGGEGTAAQSQLESLVRKGRVHALATDTHGPGDIEGRLKGIESLRLLKAEAAATLLAVRPAEVLGTASFSGYAGGPSDSSASF